MNSPAASDQPTPEAFDFAIAQAHIAELQKQRDELELKLARLQRSYDRRGEQLVLWANRRVFAERKLRDVLGTALHNALGSLEACEIVLQPKTERARLSSDIVQARAALAALEQARA